MGEIGQSARPAHQLGDHVSPACVGAPVLIESDLAAEVPPGEFGCIVHLCRPHVDSRPKSGLSGRVGGHEAADDDPGIRPFDEAVRPVVQLLVVLPRLPEHLQGRRGHPGVVVCLASLGQLIFHQVRREDLRHIVEHPLVLAGANALETDHGHVLAPGQAEQLRRWRMRLEDDHQSGAGEEEASQASDRQPARAAGHLGPVRKCLPDGDDPADEDRREQESRGNRARLDAEQLQQRTEARREQRGCHCQQTQPPRQ
ncbi:hypothetical protein [Streptomyces sp. NBC_00162]|uniref:hypothetical protein n=1 Tax=Streptomyces sp. NBC_00162 TaxID=2903629 RepID=UPI00214C506E|nr:hypothetical protein [Streptomyces sp. NBC_00162]UUU37621.1 hypothetical protein JIW86_00995 [Streptomyces sp. NBC_00162]